jgi:APA family basic amino acid/polyamine antiporter
MRLRRSAAYRPAFRAAGFPVAPLAFASICLAIVVNQVAHDLRDSLIGLGLVAAGLPVYFLWGRVRVQNPPDSASP